MTAPGDDLHASDPSDFRAEVHSFQHWFDSVEGYLQGLEHGHRAGIPERPLTESERDRLLSVLCTYCVGEEAALEASSGLVRIAPNHPTRIFLSTQVVDEARHVEVLFERIADLGVSDPEQEVAERSAPSIREFKDRLLRLVDAGEWISAIFAQNGTKFDVSKLGLVMAPASSGLEQLFEVQALAMIDHVQDGVWLPGLLAILNRGQVGCCVEIGAVLLADDHRRVESVDKDAHRTIAFGCQFSPLKISNDRRQLIVIKTFAVLDVKLDVDTIVDVLYFLAAVR